MTDVTKEDIHRLEDKIEKRLDKMETNYSKGLKYLCKKMQKSQENSLRLHIAECKNDRSLIDMKAELTAIGISVGTALTLVFQHFNLL